MPGTRRVWGVDDPLQPQGIAPLLRDCADPAEGMERPATDRVTQTPKKISFRKSTGPKPEDVPAGAAADAMFGASSSPRGS